ncbi:hypothetical protein HDU84_008533 [Entophlyctis sp. JEL0112]|nr:hypothetical protein HDU84_008533 [Entophlyctis sp. JEL0112]
MGNNNSAVHKAPFLEHKTQKAAAAVTAHSDLKGDRSKHQPGQPRVSVAAEGKTKTASTPATLVTGKGSGRESVTGSTRTSFNGVVDTVQAKTWNPTQYANSGDEDMREYHALEHNDYVLPSDVREQDRLERQHHMLRMAFNGDIVSEDAKNALKRAPRPKILDVGCANGVWAKSVKAEFPHAEVFGVDIAAESFVKNAGSEDGVSIMFGDVLDRLPFDDNTFDFVHQRLLVLGMPKDRFIDAIRELIRVAKDGAWIELVEADIVIYKPGPESKLLGTALFDAMHRRGLECYAGMNLAWSVNQVKENVRSYGKKLVSIPFNWGGEIGTIHGSTAYGFLLAVEDWMHTVMGVSREDYRQLAKNCYDEWAEHKSFGNGCAVYFQVKKAVGTDAVEAAVPAGRK